MTSTFDAIRRAVDKMIRDEISRAEANQRFELGAKTMLTDIVTVVFSDESIARAVQVFEEHDDDLPMDERMTHAISAAFGLRLVQQEGEEQYQPEPF